jgi:hypothetical protein
MKILRVLLSIVGVLLLALGAFLAYARMHDGPLAIVAGGAFASGTWSADAAADLGFLRDVQTVEFQLLSPTRSRTTWIVVHDGRLFIPSGYMNGVLGTVWKHWPHEAMADGRAVLRVDGTRHARQLVRYHGGPEAPAILAELARKYGMRATPAMLASGDLWLFELQPRTPAPDELAAGS